MRREIGYWHREGRELFYYLEFKPETAEFYLTCEHTPSEGEGSVRSVLLSEARGERYYKTRFFHGTLSTLSYLRLVMVHHKLLSTKLK